MNKLLNIISFNLSYDIMLGGTWFCMGPNKSVFVMCHSRTVIIHQAYVNFVWRLDTRRQQGYYK